MDSRTSIKRNMIISHSVLGCAAVVSTVGFYLLGQPERSMLEALHLTANIFSTVGSWSQEFSPAEKFWEILIIVFGIGAAVYCFGAVMALFTGGEIRRMMGRRQLSGKIKTLEDHYIVCGFGRMGRGVCQLLAREGVKFVLIEKSTERTTMVEELGYLYVLGDAADEVILNMARIDKAKGLVTCLGHDADNVFVTLTARELSGELLIIARAEQEATESRLRRAGADRVISPQMIGAQRVTRMLLHPALIDLIDSTVESDLAIDRIGVSEMPKILGKTLRDLELPKKFGLMVLAVVKADGTRLFSPPADHVLGEGEQLIVIGQREAVEQMAVVHGG